MYAAAFATFPSISSESKWKWGTANQRAAKLLIQKWSVEEKVPECLPLPYQP